MRLERDTAMGWRSNRRWWMVAAALVFMGFGVQAAEPTPPPPAAIVRTTKAPTIDADAADWAAIQAEHVIPLDPSGRQPGAAGAFKLAFDNGNLYALVRVNDDSPLRNGTAKPQELIKGGDAVGLMLGPIAGRGANQRIMMAKVAGEPVIIAYRPTWPEKQPHTFASPVSQLTMDYVGPLKGAKVALKETDGGYIAEASIPWTALGLAAPGPDTQVAFDVQVIFSDPGGTTNVASAWWHTRSGSAFTVEDLPTEAQLYPDQWGTARFYAQDPGPRAASVTQADAQQTAEGGAAIELQLPRSGRLSMVVTDASGWIVRELQLAEPVQAGKHVVQWDGRDRYGEPLPPGEYHWRAMLFDGVGSKFMGSVGNSGRPPYRTRDGKGSIGGQHGVPMAVAADAGGIYMLNAGEEGHPGMRKIDPRTGVSLWKKSYGGFGTGLAVAADNGIACFINRANRNRSVELVRINPDTGADVKMGNAPARYRLQNGDVAGLAIVNRRAYYSLPGENRIEVVDLNNGQAGKPLSIPNPQGLCRLDNQTLLVCSDKQVLAVPVTGGQPRPVITTDLEAPRAVAVDKAGNYYVSDLGASQQIKKFDRTGKLTATFGPVGGKPAEMIPYEPVAFRDVTGLAIGPDGHLWLVESSTPPKRFVKLTTDGKWVEDFCGPVAYNTFGIDLDDISQVYYNTDSPHLIETRVDYEKYASNPPDAPPPWKIVAIHDLTQAGDTDLMEGVAKAGYGHIISFKANNGQRYLFRLSKHNRGSRTPTGAGLWRWDGRWVPCAFLSRDAKGRNTSWVDANGDGMVQESERFGPLPTTTFAWIDRDLKLYGFDGIIAPARIDERGTPYYDGGAYTPHVAQGEPAYLGDQHQMVSAPGPDGAIYYAVNVGPHRHRSFWDRASEVRIVRINDGKAEWVIGKQDPRPFNVEISTTSGIAGAVDDMVIAHVVEPPNYVAYTTDGLTLGSVYGDPTPGARTGPTAIYIESFTGLFIKDPASGKRLLLSVSSGDDRILEVTGPGQTDRFDGKVTLTTARPREAAAVQNGVPKTEIPYQTWYGNIARGQGVDGYDYEWHPESRGLPIRNAQNVLVADVRLRRDAGALNVLADVLDDSPMQAGEGIELLIAPVDGRQPIRLALTADNAGKFTVQSGPVDGAMKPVANAKVAAVPRWRNLGYRIEAEIPLANFPALVTTAQRTYRRGGETDSKLTDIQTYTRQVADLVGPIRLNVALLTAGDAALQRLSWVDAPVDAPARWGIAAIPDPPPSTQEGK